jgi:TonB family protein
LSAVFDLHSQLSDYVTARTTINISPIAPADAAALHTSAHFASGPVFVSLPKMDQLLVARTSVAGAAQGEACTPRAALTTAYLRRNEPDYQPSADVMAWRQRVAATGAHEALNVEANETPGRATRCEIPNARAHMTRRAKPNYPKIAVQQGESGATSMRIEVDETGAVTNVSVISSGANPALDGAAIAAIKVSQFEPAAYHCLPVPGVVLFSWLFTDRPEPH